MKTVLKNNLIFFQNRMLRKNIILSLIFMMLFYVAGCAQSTLKINRFTPVVEPPFTKLFLKDNENYIGYASENYSASAALFEYDSIIILPLEIVNRTNHDILSDKYSVSLLDGRDLKSITMLNRDHLISSKSKMGGGSSSGGIQQQLIENALNSIMDVANLSEKKIMAKGLEKAINDYFEFRPIYAGEKRSGILCFLVNFKLEHPLTLMIDLAGEKIKLRFNPQ